MDKRRMKKEIFAYLATYLEEHNLSDISMSLRHHVLLNRPGKTTDAARRRYRRVEAEAIAQLRALAALTPSELAEAVVERRGYQDET